MMCSPSGSCSPTGSSQRARPHAVVAMLAVVTPTTETVTLLLVAALMLVFNEVSIQAAWLVEGSRRRRSA